MGLESLCMVKLKKLVYFLSNLCLLLLTGTVRSQLNMHSGMINILLVFIFITSSSPSRD